MVQDKANTVWTAEAALAQQKELKKGKAAAKGDSADDLVLQVANEMMNEAWLLCFDEFQVTHISDAIIMKRLFSILFERGAVVIATSNRPPEDLYLNGLNRPLFLPFIPMLRDFCDVHDIASQTDYRLMTEGEEEDRRVYLHPNDGEAKKALERKFYRLCNGEPAVGMQVETQGRRIVVPKSAVNSNVCLFSFKDLCDRPLGAADYLAIASAYHTVFVADIPKLTLQERDQVRRFITMIDAFYERHTKLHCTADLDPINLFQVTEEEKRTSVADEIFAWDRTVSRLIEMQSMKYISEHTRLIDSDQFFSQFNFQSLSNEDLVEMWRRYDGDDDGQIHEGDLRQMIEDIMEQHNGYRGMRQEEFDSHKDTLDADRDGAVTFSDFERYMREFPQTIGA
uniref:EF-hand domain-containing protein n=1 Tax=Zooxanthella nutricula TaxID=1333877 RepID=A0A7S2PJF2_9DINO